MSSRTKEESYKKEKGFTLIEVLIVVVILGVLAALVIPRMMSGPERAIVAEANQMIGAIMRAQKSRMDLGSSFLAITDNTTAATWTRLGINAPGASVASGRGAKFDYTCTAGSPNVCRATRNGAANKWVQVSDTGGWSCGSDYSVLSNGGCAPVG